MAADATPLLLRRRVLAIKAETTTGTDITPGAVDLNFYLICVHAVNGCGVDFRQHRVAQSQKIVAQKSAKYPSKVGGDSGLRIS